MKQKLAGQSCVVRASARSTVLGPRLHDAYVFMKLSWNFILFAVVM